MNIKYEFLKNYVFDISHLYLLFNVLTIKNFLEHYTLKISSKHIMSGTHSNLKICKSRILTSDVRNIYINNKKNIDIKNRVKIELIKENC